MTARIARTALLCCVLAGGAAHGADAIDAIELTCGNDLPASVDYRITYGPHWDGAWRISAVRPDAGAPYFQVDILGVERADHRVEILESHTRPALAQNVRAVRQAAVVVITEMQVLAQRGEEPDARSQRRPLTVHIQGQEGGLCADGFAHWPRIPGSYFFEAMEMVRESVVHPGRVSDPWTSIRLHLRQIRSPWR